MTCNLTLCNNCAGKIVPSLGEHHEERGLTFCCPECADAYFDPDKPDDPYPCGLAHDLGCEEGGY